MIIISNNPADVEAISQEYSANSVERSIINILANSEHKYQYDSIEQLKFELKLRKEIIQASKDLYKSNMNFEIFREAKCNPDYWDLTNEGGFKLKDGVKPSDAIRDIYAHGSKYGTECATAMVIVYYKALLSVYPEELFNQTFPSIELMNWRHIDKNLKEIGFAKKEKDFMPGDRRYFTNPDVNPLTPEWQGENTIDLDKGLYYGHGLGIYDADTIVNELNKNRKEGADKSAYLMDVAARPNFKRLFDINEHFAQ